MKFLVGVCLLFLLHLLSSAKAVVIQVENLPERCDFRKCTEPDPTKLNVHLVPHTHDDVGWLKTVDEYFFGLNVSLQNAGVQYILDSVVAELIKNKERRFIYVETAFFWKWWRFQGEHQREIVRELVKTGQLEFIGGGWSMNDEATTHYSAIVDQMTWGHRRLRDTFGRCGIPKVAWQIDPFGHSKELAALFAQMNFDALFFAREDYQDRAKRAANRTLEHVWQASADLGKAGDLFTGMMYMGYGPPSKFNWDLLGMSNQDTPVVDDPTSEEYNVPAIVEKFTVSAKAYAALYATNSILFPMGTDFQYQGAGSWYTNLDRLIKAMEKSPDIKVFYSTPSCYAKALYDTKRKWTSKVDDYFPYANAEHSYWTGYFSSRPAVKYMERYGNNVLQACKQVTSLASFKAGNTEAREQKLTRMREWMGVLQHHDAVTGTEKQHVAYDYAKNLHSALLGCVDLLLESYARSLLPKQQQTPAAKSSPETPVLQQVYCPLLNESSCPATETTRPFIVSIFNPIGHKRVGHLIKLPVTSVDTVFYSVTGPRGEEVPASLVAIPEYVQQLPGRKSKAAYELVFRVDLPPLGLATYFVAVSSTRSASSAPKAIEKQITKQTVLSGQTVKVVFGDDGSLDRLELPDGRSLKLAVDFRYFRGHTGNNIPDSHRASGAYVFRPTDDQKTVQVGRLTKAELFSSNSKAGGNLGVAEVHLQYDSFVNLVVRVDSTADLLELDWVVGPIDIKDGVGKEVILTVSLPDLANNRTFLTDANGRQMMERKWNYRPTWRLNVTEPVSGNYYPVVSRIALVDEVKSIQATLMNDRSQGGTNRVDGELELMLHRRLLHDDDFGVGEALNETGVDGRGLVVRGRHILLVGPKASAARDHRLLGVELLLQPVTTFIVNDDLPQETFAKYFNTEVAGLTGELPANVHLMTVERWKGGEGEDHLLIRLEHIFQKGEDPELSKPATVHLRHLFAHFEVVEAKELTLSANSDVEALKNRLTFDYTPIGSTFTPEGLAEPVKGEKLTIKLHPMQIRTFEVVVKRS